MDWIDLWQRLPSQISPNIFEIGSFQLRYYSLMYLVAFSFTYFLVGYRIKRERLSYTSETIQDYFVWAITGLILGARFGYILFYNLAYYLGRPWEIILPFSLEGGFHFTGLSGMSYHGGLLGLIAASLIFCRRRNIRFWSFADLFAPAVPLGYTFGRLGNFINGELYGRVAQVPWGMYFPLDPTAQLRHPSQLYAASLEGLLLFVILWNLRRIKAFPGFHLCLYLIGYGLARFIVEFFREPDQQLGLFWGAISMGQILSGLMILSGLGIILLKRKNP